MYFVYNDLIPIYDPISSLRTWLMEMLYDCHLNRIIDGFLTALICNFSRGNLFRNIP